MAMQPPKFRKEWSGGYHNFTRPINKMNKRHHWLPFKWFNKRYLMKKQRVHCKQLLKQEYDT